MPAFELASFLIALALGVYLQQRQKIVVKFLSDLKKSPMPTIFSLINYIIALGKSRINLLVNKIISLRQTIRLILSVQLKNQLKISLLIAFISVGYAMTQGLKTGNATYQPIGIALALIGSSILFVTLVSVFKIFLSKTKISVSFKWE